MRERENMSMCVWSLLSWVQLVLFIGTWMKGWPLGCGPHVWRPHPWSSGLVSSSPTHGGMITGWSCRQTFWIHVCNIPVISIKHCLQQFPSPLAPPVYLTTLAGCLRLEWRQCLTAEDQDSSVSFSAVKPVVVLCDSRHLMQTETYWWGRQLHFLVY